MKLRSSVYVLVFAGLVALIGSCGDSSADNTTQASPTSLPAATTSATTAATSESSTSAVVTTGDPTGFEATVLPILEASCARCHTGNGAGTPHLRLDTVADAIEHSAEILSSIESQLMPPWPASNLSVAFRDDWSISDDEREALIAWARRPLTDVDSETPIMSSVGIQALTEVDIELVPSAGYAGVAGQPDEYRCFIYDPELEDDAWLRGYEFVPDQTEVVHHAIGYVIPASRRQRAAELDATASDNGGWSCFGSSGTGDDEIFLGWAPGQGPTALPEGSGMLLPAGDFLVVQVHYHFEDDAPMDFSSLRLDLASADELPLDTVDTIEFIAPAEIPCSSEETGPLCDRSAALAAAIEKYGDEGVLADTALLVCRARASDFAGMTNGVASSSCDLPLRANGHLVSVLGHEHELGTTFRMTLNPDTPEEVVLLDIPFWDFAWQLNYYPVETFEVKASDVVRIECGWDRSLRDPDLEPAYIVWADGTNDEMCFATMLVRSSG